MIGSDDRANEKNVALGGGKNDRDRKPLADVQMLLHISADRENASIVSVPRDTVVPIPECKDKDGTTYKATTNRPINESLQRGGPGCTLTTWENLTGVYIDHWMMVDFAGVVAMADEVGGVPVCVKTGVWDKSNAVVKGGSGLKLKEGTSEVQGEQALQWLRTRHAFGSDQNRAKAQHMYMNGMMKKLQSQNAWTDTGRLMGLADTATRALQVSDEIKSVKKLFDLSMQLKNVKLDRLTTATVPTVAYPQRPNEWLQLVPSSADKMWTMLRDDIAFDKNGDKAGAKPKPTASAKPTTPADAPGSFGVTIVNGTDGNGEAAVQGRARALAETLRAKGFTQAESSTEGGPARTPWLSTPRATASRARRTPSRWPRPSDCPTRRSGSTPGPRASSSSSAPTGARARSTRGRRTPRATCPRAPTTRRTAWTSTPSTSGTGRADPLPSLPAHGDGRAPEKGPAVAVTRSRSSDRLRLPAVTAGRRLAMTFFARERGW